MSGSTDFSPKLQRLLEITEGLIKEKGCHNTTMQDIINRSGVSKGGIYYYVSSKDELFSLILQARQANTNDYFKQATQ